MAERENQKEHSPFRFPLSEPLPLLSPYWGGARITKCADREHREAPPGPQDVGRRESGASRNLLAAQ